MFTALIEALQQCDHRFVISNFVGRHVVVPCDWVIRPISLILAGPDPPRYGMLLVLARRVRINNPGRTFMTGSRLNL